MFLGVTWLTAGVDKPACFNSSRCFTPKLETPIDLNFPAACASSTRDTKGACVSSNFGPNANETGVSPDRVPSKSRDVSFVRLWGRE
jgi:hypothetical protein